MGSRDLDSKKLDNDIAWMTFMQCFHITLIAALNVTTD